MTRPPLVEPMILFLSIHPINTSILHTFTSTYSVGWLAQLDNATGDLFYVEQSSGMTQWTAPTQASTLTSSMSTTTTISYEPQPISTPILSAVLNALEHENCPGDDDDDDDAVDSAWTGIVPGYTSTSTSGVSGQERNQIQGQGQGQGEGLEQMDINHQLVDQSYHENPFYRLLQNKNSSEKTSTTLERRSNNNIPSPPPPPPSSEPIPPVVITMQQQQQQQQHQQSQQYNVNSSIALSSIPSSPIPPLPTPSVHPVERFSTLYLPNTSPSPIGLSNSTPKVTPYPPDSPHPTMTPPSTTPHPPSTPPSLPHPPTTPPPRYFSVSEKGSVNLIPPQPTPPPMTSISEGQNNAMGEPGINGLGQRPVRPFSHCFSAPHGSMNDSIDRNVGGRGYSLSVNEPTGAGYNGNRAEGNGMNDMSYSTSSTPPQVIDDIFLVNLMRYINSYTLLHTLLHTLTTHTLLHTLSQRLLLHTYSPSHFR